MNMPTPIVEYDLLSPMLIVFGVAIVGVLVEAFLPRQRRYAAQLVLCLGGLVAALVAVVVLARDLHGAVGRSAVMGAVVIDKPALFLQATILLVGVLGILLIAERQIGTQSEGDNGSRGLDAFTPQASAIPGCGRRAVGHQGRCHSDRGLPADDVRRRRHAAVPRLRRPADDVHRARGAVAAAVSAVRARTPAAPALAGSRTEVLSAGRIFVGVLSVRRRDAVRLCRHAVPTRDRRGGPGRFR